MEEKKTNGHLIDELSQMRHRIGELEAPEAELSALREALSIVYDAIDSTVSGVLITNLEGRIAYVNPSFLRMFEYAHRKEVIGSDVADFFDSKEIKSLADVKQMIDLTKGETGEFIVVRSDGTKFHVEVSSSHVTNEKGNIVGVMASFVDVTDVSKRRWKEKILSTNFRLPLPKSRHCEVWSQFALRVKKYVMIAVSGIKLKSMFAIILLHSSLTASVQIAQGPFILTP